MNQPPAADTATAPLSANERDILLTLFDLGRKIVSVIDLDELLPKIPELVGRLIPFDAFAVYFFQPKRDVLSVAYAVGYPENLQDFSLPSSSGLIGRVFTSRQPVVSGDVTTDPDYVNVVPGMASTLAVPLIHKAQAIGALNVLSRERDRYSEREVAILRHVAAHIATAVVNARLFERQRQDAEAFATLAEIGRDVAALLELDALLERIAQLAARLVDYRTFGILLLNETTKELELKVGVKYGRKVGDLPKVKLGEGLVGYAALHHEAVLAPDVSKDTRYIKVVEDVRSELAVPLLLKDRCIGVLDLESPDLDAFSKREVEILTLLASQAAVAIENARLYEEVSANEARLERELGFAKRVQAALLPTGLPKRVKGIDVAASFAPARELGGDFHDLLVPESSTVIAAVGDVSGKGVPAALYAVFAGELVRGRTFRRRHLPERSSPSYVLMSINTILHERQLEEYYCTLCYAVFDLKRHTMTMANSGLPYPIRLSGGECAPVVLPGVPLGSFFGVSYDEVSLPLSPGDVFVFCSDGVTEAMNSNGDEYTTARLVDVISRSRDLPARGIADAIFQSVEAHRDGYAPNDDSTVVVVRITA